MEEWTERTRQWLLEHVIWPLVRDIKEVTKAGLPLTKPLTQAQTSATAATTDGTASSSLWYGFRAAPQPTTNSFSQASHMVLHLMSICCRLSSSFGSAEPSSAETTDAREVHGCPRLTFPRVYRAEDSGYDLAQPNADDGYF